ncbi:MAG: ACP S-malonyltransferase, partial [Acidobacteriota bacterium]
AVEEYSGAERSAPRLRTLGAELITLCGPDAASLVARARQLAQGLAGSPDAEASLAFEARASRRDFRSDAPARLALVASSAAELRERLEQAASAIEASPDAPFSTPSGVHFGLGAAEGKVAFLFPGQGSQYVGMGAEMAMSFDAARAPWDLAASRDLPLHDVVFPRPDFGDGDEIAARQEAALRATEWAQPGIVCASLSLLAMVRRLGLRADMAAGHSLGEVTALCAAGVLGEGEVLDVARRRGLLMAEMAEIPGAMIAVSASRADVEAALGEIPEGSQVVVANHNSPRQVVLSGSRDAIESVSAALRERGLRAQDLPVATAFHSPIVAGASPALREALGAVDFSGAEIPVFSNASAEAYEDEADAMRDRLAAAVAEPVRFVEMVESMVAAGARTFVEVGPGSVLGGLVSRIVGGEDAAPAVVSLNRKGRGGVASFLGGIARLAALGVPIENLGAWGDEYRSPVDPRSVVKPKVSVPINGSCYGKPYPPKGGAAALPAPNPEESDPRPERVKLRAVAADPADLDLPAPTPFPSPRAAAPEAAAAAGPAALALAPALESSASDPAGSHASDLYSPEPKISEFGAAGLPQPSRDSFSENPMTTPQPPAGWLEAWQQAQEQTARVHMAYQQSMADSQSAFLKAAESSFASLVGFAPAAGSQPPAAPLAVAPVPAPLPAPAPAP